MYAHAPVLFLERYGIAPSHNAGSLHKRVAKHFLISLLSLMSSNRTATTPVCRIDRPSSFIAATSTITSWHHMPVPECPNEDVPAREGPLSLYLHQPRGIHLSIVLSCAFSRSLVQSHQHRGNWGTNSTKLGKFSLSDRGCEHLQCLLAR